MLSRFWQHLSIVIALLLVVLLLPTPTVHAEKGYDGGFVWYRVRSGDTLWGLAQRYHTTVAALRRANGLKRSLIRRGQRLRIPVTAKNAALLTAPPSSRCGKTYRVRRGDTLSSIAQHCQVKVRQIKQWNGLKKNRIWVGQKLTVSARALSQTKSRSSWLSSPLDLYQRTLPVPSFSHPNRLP
ncbi:MAG: LysM peptidoglycan-binding domain-containing protein [Chloroflexi bacterium]|nr:LysM peptidoglycan-binding domain-containing protein [Chloroflexota bacterium]